MYEETGYWCVFCLRFIKSEDGLVIHDDVPHLDDFNFMDEDNP